MNNPFKRKKPGEPTILENVCWAVGVIGVLGGAFWWMISPVSEARIQSFASGDSCHKDKLTDVLYYPSDEVVDGVTLVNIVLECRDRRKAEERLETIARQRRAVQI